MVVDVLVIIVFCQRSLADGARVFHVIYLYMKTEIVCNKPIDTRFNLRVLRSDIGYHFELLDDGKLSIGMYFLYGEKIHKAALSLGGAIYGKFHDDELTEDVMRAMDEVEDALGGCELTR